MAQGDGIDRRSFITGGAFFATTVVIAAVDKSAVAQPTAAAVVDAERFPYGVASADPNPERVLLWAAVRPRDGEQDGSIALRVEVSTDEAFGALVAGEVVDASPVDDHTVRVLVENLAPGTTYYYRFIDEAGASSRTGRTWTAPPVTEDAVCRIASFSCQHHDHGFFLAYRDVIEQEKADPSRRPDIMLHLGDYIYEFVQDHWRVPLAYPDGTPRTPASLPSGGVTFGALGARAAKTKADYRAVYRHYLTDPDLQEARSRYPFSCVWDDHEFINDCWQSGSSAGPEQKQRFDAVKVWSEYIPAMLGVAGASDPSKAFAAPARPVEDAGWGAFDDSFLNLEPNNLAAIGAITIYRSIRWGRTVELLLTDNRSYRSPSAAADELFEQTDEEIRSRIDPIPLGVLEVLSRGREASNANPPEKIVFRGKQLDNPRRMMPPTTVLGRDQKAWFKTRLTSSDAMWKVWGNAGPLMPMVFNLSELGSGLQDGILWPDSWDGIPNERRELLELVRDQRIANVVSLAGDRHAQFGGVVVSDQAQRGDDGLVGAIAEFACTSVSAINRIGVLSWQVRHDPALVDIVIDKERDDYPVLNETLMFGVNGAPTDRGPNPHLAYADTDAYGYVYTVFSKQDCVAEFVSMDKPVTFGVIEGRRSVALKAEAWSGGAAPQLKLVHQPPEETFRGLIRGDVKGG